MSAISTWSTTAANNNMATPNGWPEGQAPSTVNDCARQMMATIRTQWNNAEWFDWGFTVSKISGNQFSVAAATSTATAVFVVGRRVMLFDTSTMYGTITEASVSATTTNVTFSPDSGSLTNSFSSVQVGTTNPIVASTPAFSYYSGINRIINGDFQVWQRGAGGSAVITCAANTTKYVADRWQVVTQANTASTITQTAGSTSGSFKLKYQRDSGQTGTQVTTISNTLLRDHCIGAAGKIATLSFKIKAGANYSAASSTINVILYTGTGTSDASITTGFTGQASVFNQSIVLTTTETSWTMSSPVLGATVTQLAVVFQMTPVGTAGADDSYTITDVQLELSSAPISTPFQRLSFHEQLTRCLYFYRKSFAYSTAPAQNVGTGTGEFYFTSGIAGGATVYSSSLTFASQMRAVPTITTYNPSGADAQIRNEVRSETLTNTSLTTTIKQMLFTGTGSAATAVGDALGIHWQADSDL